VVQINDAKNKGLPYKGLLLDFGGIILKSFFETRGAMERLLKLPSGTLDWAGPFDRSSDVLWQRMLAGEISERDYWDRRASEVGKLVGQEWSIREFCVKHNELPFEVTLRPEMLKLISDAKHAGLKFGILTNELELFHGKEWLATMPFANQLDGVVDATHTKILKPDPRAYELALKALALAAEEIVFIDDQRRNVAGGEAAGIRSLHLDITDHRACIDEARIVLGL
jgi:putative hydrolase of the HAD superfamily